MQANRDDCAILQAAFPADSPFGIDFTAYGQTVNQTNPLFGPCCGYRDPSSYVACDDATGRIVAVKLRQRDLSSIFQIPEELGNLSQLQQLILSHNNLSGEIPKGLAGADRLRMIDLSYNILDGIVPSWIGDMPNLQKLILSKNNLNGALSSNFGSSNKNLTYVDLHGNGISGSIPETFTSPSIQYLDLSNNFLEGSLPSSLGSAANLFYFNVSYNNIYGTMPPSIGNLLTLATIDASFNAITGSLPNSMGNLTNITQIFLNNNALVGQIPSSFSQLRYLSDLRLQSNQLSGQVPQGVVNLPALRNLILDNNCLSINPNPTRNNLTISISNQAQSFCPQGNGTTDDNSTDGKPASSPDTGKVWLVAAMVLITGLLIVILIVVSVSSFMKAWRRRKEASLLNLRKNRMSIIKESRISTDLRMAGLQAEHDVEIAAVRNEYFRHSMEARQVAHAKRQSRHLDDNFLTSKSATWDRAFNRPKSKVGRNWRDSIVKEEDIALSPVFNLGALASPIEPSPEPTTALSASTMPDVQVPAVLAYGVPDVDADKIVPDSLDRDLARRKSKSSSTKARATDKRLGRVLAQKRVSKSFPRVGRSPARSPLSIEEEISAGLVSGEMQQVTSLSPKDLKKLEDLDIVVEEQPRKKSADEVLDEDRHYASIQELAQKSKEMPPKKRGSARFSRFLFKRDSFLASKPRPSFSDEDLFAISTKQELARQSIREPVFEPRRVSRSLPRNRGSMKTVLSFNPYTRSLDRECLQSMIYEAGHGNIDASWLRKLRQERQSRVSRGLGEEVTGIRPVEQAVPPPVIEEDIKEVKRVGKVADYRDLEDYHDVPVMAAAPFNVQAQEHEVEALPRSSVALWRNSVVTASYMSRPSREVDEMNARGPLPRAISDDIQTIPYSDTSTSSGEDPKVLAAPSLYSQRSSRSRGKGAGVAVAKEHHMNRMTPHNISPVIVPAPLSYYGGVLVEESYNPSRPMAKMPPKPSIWSGIFALRGGPPPKNKSIHSMDRNETPNSLKYAFIGDDAMTGGNGRVVLN
ncbi:hypothetical protein HDU97_007206 [Phlyctochytrium planicorne]|nr:hypothetical protein HDU97_007206 [Phlyctochytrium planicorne]